MIKTEILRGKTGVYAKFVIEAYPFYFLYIYISDEQNNFKITLESNKSE